MDHFLEYQWNFYFNIIGCFTYRPITPFILSSKYLCRNWITLVCLLNSYLVIASHDCSVVRNWREIGVQLFLSSIATASMSNVVDPSVGHQKMFSNFRCQYRKIFIYGSYDWRVKTKLCIWAFRSQFIRHPIWLLVRNEWQLLQFCKFLLPHSGPADHHRHI